MQLEAIALPPMSLRVVNSARDAALLERLIRGMKDNGWLGRPLLVEEEAVRSTQPQYFAWTGSHRIEAAIQAQLPEVPCRVLRHHVAETAFVAAGFDIDSYQCWRDAIGHSSRRQELLRYQALVSAGLSEAAALLEQEFKATDGHA